MWYIFTVCAHGKEDICRLPDRIHTANYQAHGKEPDYDSAKLQSDHGGVEQRHVAAYIF